MFMHIVYMYMYTCIVLFSSAKCVDTVNNTILISEPVLSRRRRFSQSSAARAHGNDNMVGTCYQ